MVEVVGSQKLVQDIEVSRAAQDLVEETVDGVRGRRGICAYAGHMSFQD
jgi:hypothetical protein